MNFDEPTDEELALDIEALTKDIDGLNQENSIYESYLNRCQVCFAYSALTYIQMYTYIDVYKN